MKSQYKQRTASEIPGAIKRVNHRLTSNPFNEPNIPLAKFVNSLFRPISVEDFCNRWLTGLSKKSQYETIAALCGCSPATVKDWLAPSVKAQTPAVVQNYLGAINSIYYLLHQYDVAFRKKL